MFACMYSTYVQYRAYVRSKSTECIDLTNKGKKRLWSLRQPFLRRLPRSCRCHYSWMSVVSGCWWTWPLPSSTSICRVLRRSASLRTAVGWTELFGYDRSPAHRRRLRNSSHDAVPVDQIADRRFWAPVPSPGSSTDDVCRCTWRRNSLTSLSSPQRALVKIAASFFDKMLENIIVMKSEYRNFQLSCCYVTSLLAKLSIVRYHDKNA